MPSNPRHHGLRLNVGCGDDFRPGWLNIDCRPLYPAGPEFVCGDVRSLDDFVGDESALEIVAQDVLQFVGWREVDAVFISVTRKLRPDGLLHVRVPDADAVMSAYAAGELPASAVQESLYGRQGYTRDAILSLWNEESLLRRFAMCGLKLESCEPKGRLVQATGRRLS